MARCAVIREVARNKVIRWLKAIGNDRVALAQVISTIDEQGATGDAFDGLVEQLIERHMRETRFGLPLPFPPALKASG